MRFICTQRRIYIMSDFLDELKTKSESGGIFNFCSNIMEIEAKVLC